MTNNDIIYIETESPFMSVMENLNFKRLQRFLYKSICVLIEQNFTRDEFISKVKTIIEQITNRTNRYFVCTFEEIDNLIRIELFVSCHSMSKAEYEITYIMEK